MVLLNIVNRPDVPDRGSVEVGRNLPLEVGSFLTPRAPVPGDNELPPGRPSNGDRTVDALDPFDSAHEDEGGVARDLGDKRILARFHTVVDGAPSPSVLPLRRPLVINARRRSGKPNGAACDSHSRTHTPPRHLVAAVALDLRQ